MTFGVSKARVHVEFCIYKQRTCVTSKPHLISVEGTLTGCDTHPTPRPPGGCPEEL